MRISTQFQLAGVLNDQIDTFVLVVERHQPLVRSRELSVIIF